RRSRTPSAPPRSFRRPLLLGAAVLRCLGGAVERARKLALGPPPLRAAYSAPMTRCVQRSTGVAASWANLTLQQAELSAPGHRSPEQIGAQRDMARVEAQASRRQAEAHSDLLGIGAGAALADAEGGDVVPAAVHGTKD